MFTENLGQSPDIRTAARLLYYRRNMEEFFKKELRIRTKEIGYSNFIPNPVQVAIIRGIEKQLKEQGKIRQIWFKGRQVGASTLASAIVFHKIALYPGANALAVAQDKTTAAKLFSMSDLYYKNLSSDIKPPRKYFTKGQELVLGDDPDDPHSRGVTSMLLTAEAKNVNIGVGATLHVLHLSEIARYPSSAPLTESLFPACSDAPGTIRIIESTAHFGGAAGFFRDLCERAMDGRGEYQYQFIPWWLQNEYAIPLAKGERFKLDSKGDYPDEKYLHKKVGLTLENLKWRRNKIDEFNGDVTLFYLSYPTNFTEGFITRDATAFPYSRLVEMQQHIRPPVKRFTVNNGQLFEDPEGLLHVWRMPEVGKVYDIGADVAGGDASTDGAENAKAGDFSVAEVVQRGSLEQCAEWRGHVLPREFGDILAAIGRFYNLAQIAPEVNTFGMSTLERLREIYPSTIYLWRKRDGMAIKYTGKLGWVTSYESKSLLVNTMREKLYYQQVLVHSKLLIDEMLDFVRDFTPTGMVTYSASSGYDDSVMAFMIAVQTSDDENYSKYDSLSVRDTKEEKPQVNYDPAFYDVEGLTPSISDAIDSGGW